MLAGEPALVAVQLVNNETGVVQPIDDIQQIVRSANSLLLCDCAQAAGKIALPGADFVAITSQKFGGAPGSGALLVRDLGTIQPSGGQERGYRRGTENLPGIAGMAAALESQAFARAMPRLEGLRGQLESELIAAGGLVIAAGAPRIATIGAYAMPGVASASQLVQLDLAGISVSAGSACSSGSMKASRVLKAMRIPDEIASAVIRVSFGPSTSEHDIDRFFAEWRKIGSRAKACGMIYLDYQATTPVAPEVAKAMLPWIEEKFANPHSASRWGSEVGSRGRSCSQARRRCDRPERRNDSFHGQRDRRDQLGPQGHG